jgi:AAA domain
MNPLDLAKPLDEEVPWIKMVLHGFPGVGKTYFAAHAPDPVFIDFERSTETLRKIAGKEKTPVVRPETFKQVRDFVKVAPDRYGTIVFDTVSSMQTFYMREYMIVEGAKPGRDKFLPYQGDYRYATNELSDLWLELQEMACNVIFLAHTKEHTNDQGNVVALRPLLTPAVGDALSQFINVIGYLELKPNPLAKTTDRLLYLNSTNIILAKNRLGITEQSLKNPTFGDIFNAS